MKTRQYIESGILEAYALGTLSPAEAEAVALAVAQHPELAAELTAIEETLIRMAEAAAVSPAPGTDDKIWAAIQWKEAREEEAKTGAPKTIPFTPTRSSRRRWQLAAAVLLLAGSMGMNAMLWQKTQLMENKTDKLAQTLDSLNREKAALTRLVNNYLKAKDMMADTAVQTIVMHTVLKGHPMAATLYWSKEKGEAWVSADGLPPPPPGMQYQLWVIKSGKPVGMGMLPEDMANTPSIMKVAGQITEGEAFAISLEKAGGVPSPTVENIYVVGKA